MDDVSNRTIMMAVGIFITITIVSLVIVMFSEMEDIYGVVINTDIGIASKFDDFYSMYHGKVETGIGLLNTVKKYQEEDGQNIEIYYPNSEDIKQYISNYNLGRNEENKLTEAIYLKVLMEKQNGTKKYEQKYDGVEIIGTFKYEDKYNVIVEENQQREITITYNKVR